MLTRTALLFVVFLASARGEHSPAQIDTPANRKLIKALQGKWQCVSRLDDGVRGDADFTRNRVLVVKGNIWTVYDKGKRSFTVQFKVDASKKPIHIDTSIPGDSDEMGILKLEGDTLTLCSASDGDDRPDEFKSPRGSDWLLTVWKRVKK